MTLVSRASQPAEKGDLKFTAYGVRLMVGRIRSNNKPCGMSYTRFICLDTSPFSPLHQSRDTLNFFFLFYPGLSGNLFISKLSHRLTAGLVHMNEEVPLIILPST